MTEKKSARTFLKRFINIITFVDLPIRKKFMLFSIGVLFWFVVMFVISITTIIDINSKSGEIVNNIMPHDRVAQKITHKLQNLNVDAAEIINTNDVKHVNQITDIARSRIEDIRNFLTTVRIGGQINDIQRENGKLLESFSVQSVKGDTGAEKYVNNMESIVDDLFDKVKTLSALKVSILGKGVKDDGQLQKELIGFKQQLQDAISLSNEYSSQAVKLYAVNSGKIKFAIRCTSFTAVGVLLIATFLLTVFTLWISRSIAQPVKSIINQIRSLGEGEVDPSKRIEITSKDEIGTLSQDFNELMEEIHGMATFKKVIEEDENLEDVYSRMGKVFGENFGLYECIIYEVSNSQNKMKPVYPIILDDKEIFCNEEILQNCNLCRAKKTGHEISSIAYHNICKQFRPDLDKLHICVPMIVGGSTGGVVQFLFDKKYAGSDNKDSRIYKAQQYIKESLSVIEAKRLMNTLRDSALKDSLTGLYNRRFLQEYTETLVAGIMRRGKNVGLIMCDLDYFKQVNDVYGHSVGDLILKETSAIIKTSIRTADLVIRFGGEEFLVLLLDIQEGESFLVAEKIRNSIQEAKIKVPDGILRKTISLGISEFPLDTQGFWQAIKFADVALYRAKETGRNKSVRFTADMWKEEQF